MKSFTTDYISLTEGDFWINKLEKNDGSTILNEWLLKGQSNKEIIYSSVTNLSRIN